MKKSYTYFQHIKWIKRIALTLKDCKALPEYKNGDIYNLVFAPTKYADDATPAIFRIKFCQLNYEIYSLQK